jgi:hypothetical protein
VGGVEPKAEGGGGGVVRDPTGWGGLQAVVSGPPVPAVHDEFSYLLAGSTFARGMITNQTHPMWVHFETPHVIQTPTRMSKYPPGQGVFLAAGYLLGHPWIGVVLSTLVMILLVYWAARQWVAPWWALVAGVFGLGTVLGTYWTGSYWGGALNAAAGALVTGSAGALRRRCSKMHLALFALGACLCAATRPYEGLVLVSSLSAWLIWRALRGKGPSLKDYLRASLPAAAVVAVFAAAFLYYDYRVTGNPLTTPYSVASHQYLASKMFLFQEHPPVPEYRHKMLRRSMSDSDGRRSPSTGKSMGVWTASGLSTCQRCYSRCFSLGASPS